MNRKLIAGNWKMNLDIKSSEKLAKQLTEGIGGLKQLNCDVLICPAFVSLYACSKILRDSKIMLGAQNMSSNDDGAFTGEISATMLISAGCSHVIIGHSERRKYCGETNETVNAKVLKALEKGLKPILCVGETLQEREDEIYREIVAEQLTEGLKAVEPESVTEITVAYEPVWAIGTGVNATPRQASDMHVHIRKMLSELYSVKVTDAIRILYGGSVNAGNAGELLSSNGIDGALVGGASLKPDEFLRIVSAC